MTVLGLWIYLVLVPIVCGSTIVGALYVCGCLRLTGEDEPDKDQSQPAKANMEALKSAMSQGVEHRLHALSLQLVALSATSITVDEANDAATTAMDKVLRAGDQPKARRLAKSADQRLQLAQRLCGLPVPDRTHAPRPQAD